MAGYSKLYVVGGLGGFMGADGVNPIEFLVLIGDADRQWLEPHYFDVSIRPIGRLRVIVPAGPDVIVYRIMLWPKVLLTTTSSAFASSFCFAKPVVFRPATQNPPDLAEMDGKQLRPDHPDSLLDACIAFCPRYFRSCPSLAKVEPALRGAERLDFDAHPEAIPETWPRLRDEARPLLARMNIWRADLVPIERT